MASLSAAHRVFGVAELAEMIFLQMPAQNILVNAQRVCRQWKAVIERSKPLQQALLFQPISSIRVGYPKGEDWKLHRLGPWGWMDVDTCAITPTVEHPLTVRRKYSDSFHLSQYSQDRVQRPEASWRRQLYVQPPAPSVTLITDSFPEVDIESAKVELEGHEGVIMDQIRKAAGGYDICICNADRLEKYEWDVESAASFLERMTNRVLSYLTEEEYRELEPEDFSQGFY